MHPGGITGARFETPIEDHLGQIWLIALMPRSRSGSCFYWADQLRTWLEASPTFVSETRC